MANDPYFTQAINTLAAYRQNETVALQKRRQEITNKIPLYSSLESAFIQAGITLAQTGKGQEKLLSLEQQKTALLTTAGFPKNYLDLHYHCTHCKDTGYTTDGALCSCVQDLMKKLRRDSINKLSPLALSTFSSFDLSYYTTIPDTQFRTIPREHMASVLAYCNDYAHNFHRGCESLLMMGAAGLGKTHLALAIAGQVLEKGYDVIYISSQSAFSKIESEKFSSAEETLLPALLSADLLVLDDLGTEYLSPYILAELYNVINTRMLTKKTTIYTTNLNAESGIKARYTEKISSRLLGNCTLLHFFGKDIRLQKSLA